MRYKLRGGATVLALGGSVRKEKPRAGAQPHDGNLYEGECAWDLKCGQGTLQWFHRGERYSRRWRGDVPHGWGEHVWLEPRPDPSATGTPGIGAAGSGTARTGCLCTPTAR